MPAENYTQPNTSMPWIFDNIKGKHIVYLLSNFDTTE